MPVGIATSPIPKIAIIEENSLPPAIRGYTSPYLTVVSVHTAHHKDHNILGKAPGCVWCSKK